jgi:hypothetical protein
MSLSDLVIRHVQTAYLGPARERGERTVRVKAGDVHRDLRWANRVPSVCTTLSSRKFQRTAGVELIAKEGPPSGQSTTVVFTYRLSAASGHPHLGRQPGRLDKLYGIASEIFRELGGGEKFVREEREKLNFRKEVSQSGHKRKV